MTLTQTGTTISGTLAPLSVDFGGITSVFAGTIIGVTAGPNVNLTFQNTITVRAGSDSLICRGVDTWTGTQTGNTLTGTLMVATTAYTCDGGIPLPLPPLPNGPVVFTRP